MHRTTFRPITSTVAPLVATLSLLACSIAQTAAPAPPATKRICVIDNPKVWRDEFFLTYQKALVARGFEVQLLAADSPVHACPLVSTYTANWAWDLSPNLVYAELRIYRHGKPVGAAIFDVGGVSARIRKATDAEARVKELVDRLFPPSPG